MKKLILLWVLLGTLTLHAQTLPVTFKNTIPVGYDPTSQAPGFMEVSPNIAMPQGHVLVKPPTNQSYTWLQTFAKGGSNYNSIELGN